MFLRGDESNHPLTNEVQRLGIKHQEGALALIYVVGTDPSRFLDQDTVLCYKKSGPCFLFAACAPSKVMNLALCTTYEASYVCAIESQPPLDASIVVYYHKPLGLFVSTYKRDLMQSSQSDSSGSMTLTLVLSRRLKLGIDS